MERNLTVFEGNRRRVNGSERLVKIGYAGFRSIDKHRSIISVYADAGFFAGAMPNDEAGATGIAGPGPPVLPAAASG